MMNSYLHVGREDIEHVLHTHVHGLNSLPYDLKGAPLRRCQRPVAPRFLLLLATQHGRNLGLHHGHLCEIVWHRCIFRCSGRICWRGRSGSADIQCYRRNGHRGRSSRSGGRGWKILCFHLADRGVDFLPGVFIITNRRWCHLGGRGLVFAACSGCGQMVCWAAFEQHWVVGWPDKLPDLCCENRGKVLGRGWGGLRDWPGHQGPHASTGGSIYGRGRGSRRGANHVSIQRAMWPAKRSRQRLNIRIRVTVLCGLGMGHLQA